MGSSPKSLAVAAAFVSAATLVGMNGQQQAQPLGLEQVKDGLYAEIAAKP